MENETHYHNVHASKSSVRRPLLDLAVHGGGEEPLGAIVQDVCRQRQHGPFVGAPLVHQL